jgi:riboflavin synthase
MFTGIVQPATVHSFDALDNGGARLVLELSFATDLELGESVAVNGCCLTVAEMSDTTAAFDLLQETMRVTNLGDLKTASLVNVERALQIGDRLSGHFVQGHVDTTAEVLALEADGQDHRYQVAVPEQFRRYLIRKGSITIDGMSLTAADIDESSMTIWITPHTFQVTNLRDRQPGQRVNLEFDMLAKYVEGFVDA